MRSPFRVLSLQAEMVVAALGQSDAASNTDCPAGMIGAAPGTQVEWLLSEESFSQLSEAASA